MDFPGQDAARLALLAADLVKVEEEGQRVRDDMRRLLEELDRLAKARRELESRIQRLMAAENGGMS